MNNIRLIFFLCVLSLFSGIHADARSKKEAKQEVQKLRSTLFPIFAESIEIDKESEKNIFSKNALLQLSLYSLTREIQECGLLDTRTGCHAPQFESSELKNSVRYRFRDKLKTVYLYNNLYSKSVDGQPNKAQFLRVVKADYHDAEKRWVIDPVIKIYWVPEQYTKKQFPPLYLYIFAMKGKLPLVMKVHMAQGRVEYARKVLQRKMVSPRMLYHSMDYLLQHGKESDKKVVLDILAERGPLFFSAWPLNEDQKDQRQRQIDLHYKRLFFDLILKYLSDYEADHAADHEDLIKNSAKQLLKSPSKTLRIKAATALLQRYDFIEAALGDVISEVLTHKEKKTPSEASVVVPIEEEKVLLKVLGNLIPKPWSELLKPDDYIDVLRSFHPNLKKNLAYLRSMNSDASLKNYSVVEVLKRVIHPKMSFVEIQIYLNQIVYTGGQNEFSKSAATSKMVHMIMDTFIDTMSPDEVNKFLHQIRDWNLVRTHLKRYFSRRYFKRPDKVSYEISGINALKKILASKVYAKHTEHYAFKKECMTLYYKAWKSKLSIDDIPRLTELLSTQRERFEFNEKYAIAYYEMHKATLTLSQLAQLRNLISAPLKGNTFLWKAFKELMKLRVDEFEKLDQTAFTKGIQKIIASLKPIQLSTPKQSQFKMDKAVEKWVEGHYDDESNGWIEGYDAQVLVKVDDVDAYNRAVDKYNEKMAFDKDKVRIKIINHIKQIRKLP